MKPTSLIRSLALGAAMVGALTLSVRANELVFNGDFETGSFSNWTQSGDQSATLTLTGPFAHGGNFGAAFGPIFSEGYIEQSITTIVGATYDFSFWLMNFVEGTPNSFSVSWDGNVLTSLTDAPQFDYTQYNFLTTATSTSTLIQFAFFNQPGFYALDDVSVMVNTLPPDPEPDPEPGVPDATSTLGLLALALAGLGAARRQRAG